MAQMKLSNKVHKAAVAIVPPLHVTHAIQRIRCFKDKSYVRWPPHINLLYPFLEDAGDNFATAATKAAAAVAAIKPFKLKLSSLSYFEHGRNNFTMWLKPDDTSGLCAVQSSLEAAFPDCTDLSNDPGRGIMSFTPHLSLGQWRDKHQMMDDMKLYMYGSEGLSLEFDVTEVCIMSRRGYTDPFTIRCSIPLGTSTNPPSAAYPKAQQFNVPYIATTAAHLQQLLPISSPTDPARFGLGGASCGIWNFAYGANMSPKKLGGSRGLHPLESKPGVLKGYKLRFNHRGGFGNVVPVDAADSSSSTAAAAPDEVHGVLHRLTAAELCTLMNMEHEYWPVEVAVQPYSTQQQQQQQKSPNSAAAVSSDTADDLPPSQAQQQMQQASDDSTADQQTQGQKQQQQQQQDPILAVAFMSPPDRLIRDDLPTITRYHDLLTDGAQHWKLPDYYTDWLQKQPHIPSEQRGQEYYTSAVNGEKLEAWPKIRTGSQQQQGRGRGGRGASKKEKEKSG